MADMPKTFRPPYLPSQQQRSREHDDKRRADQPWRAWYKTSLWLKRRAMQLREFPLCERCAQRGETVPATVANHIGGHNGDRERFFWGSLESACKACHDGEIQREEAKARKGKPC